MQVIKRINSSEDALGFEVDLRYINKTLADIDDIFFVVKEEKTDPDDSLFLKKWSLSEIAVSGTDYLTVAVQWDHDDYTGFVIDKTYVAGLFVKFTGQAKANENVDETFHLIIEQDTLIDN